MCTLKIISSFASKIRIIIIKTCVTFLLVNRLSVCTRQTDCQLSKHNNIITVHRNLEYWLADFNFCATQSRLFIIDAVSSEKNKITD